MEFEKPDALIIAHNRSGTHFLQNTIASHPQVNARGECIFFYQRHLFLKRSCLNVCGKTNIAIVMYSQVSKFEELCGSIFQFKIIHLLRDPAETARSTAQWEADRKTGHHRAHYSLMDEIPQPTPILASRIEELQHRIASLQEEFTLRLKDHPDILALRYEDLTGNQQVNILSDEKSDIILKFLRLDYHVLTNDLKKTNRV